jgi:C2H2 transcription facotor
MSPFRAVNPPSASDRPADDQMPTTSQANDAPQTPQTSQPPQSQSQPQQPQPPNPAVDDATTPTMANFAPNSMTTGMSAQRPFPSEAFKDLSATITELPTPAVSTPPRRNDSQRSQVSSKRSRRDSRDSVDMDVDTSDDENAGSSGESVNADGTPKNKKKKTQRFYCTGFPPCKLSFTRSEHLARHIR